MHPHISAFPSAAFYDHRLTDGPSMDVQTRQEWHSNALFPPYAFMHVNGGSEVAGRNHALSNPREASTALAIYEALLRDYPKVNFDLRIGIVTPYKGQVNELKKQFRNRFGMSILDKISFATVDVRLTTRLAARRVTDFFFRGCRDFKGRRRTSSCFPACEEDRLKSRLDSCRTLGKPPFAKSGRERR